MHKLAVVVAFSIGCGGSSKPPTSAPPPTPSTALPQKSIEVGAMGLVVVADVPDIIGSEVQTAAYRAFSDAGWKVLVEPATDDECRQSSASVCLRVTRATVTASETGGCRRYAVELTVGDLRDAAWTGDVAWQAPADATCEALLARELTCAAGVAEDECSARENSLTQAYALVQQRLTGKTPTTTTTR